MFPLPKPQCYWYHELPPVQKLRMHWARSCIRSAYLLSTAPITLSTRLPAICPCPGPCSYPPRARVWASGIHAGEGSKIPPLCLEDSVQLDIYLDRYVDSESEGECKMSCVWWRCYVLTAEDLKRWVWTELPLWPHLSVIYNSLLCKH